MRENNNFRDYYDIVKKIGEGINGIIYEVKLKDTNEKRAIKVYDKKRIMNQYLANNKDENAAEKEMKKIIDNFLNEIKIMKIV
jgi:serine/threonine protein kinase